MALPIVTKTKTKLGLIVPLALAIIVSIGILITPSFFPISQRAYTIPSGCYGIGTKNSPRTPSVVINSSEDGVCYKGTVDCFDGGLLDIEEYSECRNRRDNDANGYSYTFCPDKNSCTDISTIQPTIVIKSPSSGVSVPLGSSINFVSEVRNDTTGKYSSVEWFDNSGLLKYGSSITHTFTTPGAKTVYAVGGTNNDTIVSSKITINITNPTGSQPGCCSYQRSDGPFQATNVYENICLSSQYPEGKWTPTCSWYRCKSTGGYESCSPYNSATCNLMFEQVSSCGAGVQDGTGLQNNYYKCNFNDKTCSSCTPGTAGCVVATDCSSACQISYPTYTCSGSPNYTCTQKVCTPGTSGCYSWIKDCTDVCKVPILNWCVAGSTGGQCVASATKPAGTVINIFSTASKCSLNCSSSVAQTTGCCTQTSYLLGKKTSMTTKSLCKPNLMYPRAVTFVAGKTCSGALINEVDLCLNVTGTQSVIPSGSLQDSFGNCYCNPSQPGACPDTSIPDTTLKTSIAGTVSRNNEGDFQTSDTNLAISGARVSFFDLTDKKEYGPVLSLSDGKYQISNVPISTFGVHVKADGYVQYCGKVSSPNPMADFKLYPLKMPTTISGGTFNGVGYGGRPTATPQLASSLQCLYNKLNNNVEFEGYELRYTSLGRYGTNVACHGKTVGEVTADYAADIQVFKDGVNKLKIGDKVESNKLCKLVEETAKTCKFTSLLDERNNATPLGCQDYSATGEAVHLHLSVCNCDDKDYNGNAPLSCTADNSITDYTCSF